MVGHCRPTWGMATRSTRPPRRFPGAGPIPREPASFRGPDRPCPGQDGFVPPRRWLIGMSSSPRGRAAIRDSRSLDPGEDHVEFIDAHTEAAVMALEIAPDPRNRGLA